MNLSFELLRAETVNRALTEAASEFRLRFEAKGFVIDEGRPLRADRSHLGVILVVEAPHRVRIRFEGFWKQRKEIPVELLVTDEEKIFWMNTLTNREHMTFGRALDEILG